MDNKQRLVNDANSNPYTDPLVRTVSSQPTVQLPNSTPNPAPNPAVIIPTISRQTPPDKIAEKSNSTSKSSKSSSILHTLFAGKRKFITIPVIIFIVAETSLLILFLTGAISLKPVTDNSITATTNDEATDLYNDVTNESSAEDTLNYWNSQISMYETRKDYLEAYNLRIKAADFYIDREDNATAFTILRNTKMGDAIGLPERFTLYSLIITLANNQGYYDIAKAYQDAIPTLNSTTIFDGSATAKYNQLKELSIPTNDATTEEEDGTLESNGDMSMDNANSSNLEEQPEPTEPVDDDPNAEESVEWE